jgi:predicted nucleic acid-binding protein
VRPAIVIDANIILSAVISRKGLPNQLLDIFFSEAKFEVIASPAIIAEWYQCVSRKSIQKPLVPQKYNFSHLSQAS